MKTSPGNKLSAISSPSERSDSQSPAGVRGGMKPLEKSDDDSSEESSSDDDDSDDEMKTQGQYNPQEYANLNVY